MAEWSDATKTVLRLTTSTSSNTFGDLPDSGAAIYNYSIYKQDSKLHMDATVLDSQNPSQLITQNCSYDKSP